MRRIAFIEYIKAVTRGYFWLPCPQCGRMFGGHENGGCLDYRYGTGKATCSDPLCMKEVAVITEERNLRWILQGAAGPQSREWVLAMIKAGECKVPESLRKLVENS